MYGEPSSQILPLFHHASLFPASTLLTSSLLLGFIREMDQEKLKNNKKEWIQPGDIRVEYKAEESGRKEGKLSGEIMGKITREKEERA